MNEKVALPPPKYVDAQAYIAEHTVPELDKQVEEMRKKKALLKEENHRLTQILLSMERRNQGMLEQLEREKVQRQQSLEEHIDLFHKTEKECQEEIQRAQVEIRKDYQQAEQIVIGHKKERNHLKFNLEEKREVDETRIAMLEKRDQLTQELKDVTKELRAKYDLFEREQFAQRNAQREAAEAKLKEMISEAKAQIDKEKLDTLRESEREWKVLAEQVTQFQKVVTGLRDEHEKLVEEANELEMKLMEAKLVSQLAKPDSGYETIGKLQEEKEKLEEEKIRARTKPEAENRRRMTQHINAMKKKRNELSGFMKLNSLKHEEMEQLRALAMNVIEQRNALMTFMNETISALRHEIASTYDQRGQPFRTSELILCHLNEGDDDVLGRQFSPSDMGTNMTASDQLKLLEVLYSRFSGIPQPRKIEEVI